MIRILGHASVLLSVFIIGVLVGVESALYWGSPALLKEAARLRVMQSNGSLDEWEPAPPDLILKALAPTPKPQTKPKKARR